MMKNKIFWLILGFLIVSFSINFYIEQKLDHTFQYLKIDNIRDLEHVSNKNFYKYKIENIGKHLKSELIKVNVDECSFLVRKDYFYFFQNKVIYIKNDKKCLKLTVNYNLIESLFKIKGFQNCS